MSDANRAVLASADSTLGQLMQAIGALEAAGRPRRIKLGLSSSATVDLLGVYLRKHGLLAGVQIEIVPGNYDDPIGDIDLFIAAGVEQIVMLPFFDTLLPAFEAQLGTLAPDAVDAKESELRMRYRLALDKARAIGTVYLGTFHRMGAALEAANNDAVAVVLARFNAALREEAAAFPNVRLVDIEAVVRAIGQQGAFDTRFYYRSKAPYTGAFMNELARRIALASRGFGSHFYKVLVLDCDNTLWGGVIGEDLLAGIKLGPYDYPGNIFWRMQHEFAALERAGVLLCLCTKNNPADVDEVLRAHPEMVLRDASFVVKKVNWDDKPGNLRAIAAELNVGLDSMVFLDDSSFECEAVRQQLPMVHTVQVPSALPDYPRVVRELGALFLAGGISAESSGKTEQYRQRAGAEAEQARFDNQQDYLASLELKVELARNARASSARISELSMKSNQFNLTTRRYTETEIVQAMERGAVYSLTVADKFGKAGLTGVALLRYDGARAVVDNFFMSCRVIGRGVETAIWARIVADAVARGCTELGADFVPSPKNAQVADFYDRLGLPLSSTTSDGARTYLLDAHTFVPPDTSWIEMSYVE
ncbi:MAG: HAD-IIIC family phosphatase [Pseudomonadota bacterium]